MAQKNLSIKLSLNDRQFQSRLRKATRSLKRFGTSMKRTGQTMTRSLTMPLIALGAASVKLATDFETSMTKISTLVGASAQELKEYENGIMQLSNQVGISAKELADGLFFITSVGFKGAEALDALEISAKASAMGMGEMASISNALTSIMTAYADEQMTASKAGDLLHETLKQGKFEAGQFMEKLGSVIPVAAAAGVSMEELGAASATMSKLSGDAAGTLTAMRSLLMSLQKPSAQQEEILDKLNMTTSDLSDMIGKSLMGTLEFLFDKLGDNNQELLTMFGSSKAVVGALSTMGLQAETYAEVLDGMGNSLGNVNNGFDILSGTSGFKFKQTLVKLQNVGIQIGNILLPIVLDLADGFKNILDEFNKLSPEAKKMSVAIGILAGALGPLLIVLGSVVTILTALSIELIAITSYFIAVGLAILYINDNWEAFIERFKDTTWWKNTLLEMTALAIEYNPVALLNKGLGELFEQLGVKNPFKSITNANEKFAESFRSLKDDVKDFENDFEDFDTFIENQGKKISKVLQNFTGGLNLGGGGSGGGSGGGNEDPKTKNQPQGVMGPPIPEDVLKRLKELKKQEENIVSLTEQLQDSFMSFGNVLQGTFAQALQSSEGFFKSFVEGSKRAMSALLAQLAATLALNALLGGSKFGQALGFKSIGGAGGIGSILKGLIGLQSGGLATGATLAMVGEGPGTSLSNPEVIAPLDKLKSMIGINGGGAVEVFGTISGQDILLSSDRARNNRTRTRGY